MVRVWLLQYISVRFCIYSFRLTTIELKFYKLFLVHFVKNTKIPKFHILSKDILSNQVVIEFYFTTTFDSKVCFDPMLFPKGVACLYPIIDSSREQNAERIIVDVVAARYLSVIASVIS